MAFDKRNNHNSNQPNARTPQYSTLDDTMRALFEEQREGLEDSKASRRDRRMNKQLYKRDPYAD